MKITATTQGKLAFFQELYEDAKNKRAGVVAELDKYMEQYEGSKKIDGLDQETDYCRNITAELIESQVNSYIPPAQVRPERYSKTNNKLAKLAQDYLNKMADKLPFEKLNDLDERLTYIFGASVWLVEWDNSIMTHDTMGNIKTTILNPKQFIPQPAVYELQDMEYCFIEYEDTHENLERKFGITFEQAQALDNEKDTDSDDTATCVVCFYKDDADLICQYIWADNTELSDIEDYWARKEDKCSNCKKTKELCKCDKPLFEKSNLDYEEITEEMSFFDGLKVITPLTKVIKNGMPVMEEVDVPVLVNGMPMLQDINGVNVPVVNKQQVPKTKPTRVPFYKPSLFPIVIRKNISMLDSLYGQSDCKFIRDQQQCSNKLETRINKKLINSGVAITHGENTKIDLTSDIYKKGISVKNPADAALIRTLDLQVNTQQDEKRAEKVYQDAKRVLGISDSFQGQPDSTAQSGRAKEIQAMQSGGRLESKRIMKNAAYAEMYEIMFQYFLAFADEPRPISNKDDDGQEMLEEFNKYAFLEIDKAGEWYYNDEFLFSTSKVADMQANREAMWQLTKENFSSGTYGKPADIDTLIYYWKTMESLHYPTAEQTVAMFQRKKQAMLQMAQQQMGGNQNG